MVGRIRVRGGGGGAAIISGDGGGEAEVVFHSLYRRSQLLPSPQSLSLPSELTIKSGDIPLHATHHRHRPARYIYSAQAQNVANEVERN